LLREVFIPDNPSQSLGEAPGQDAFLGHICFGFHQADIMSNSLWLYQQRSLPQVADELLITSEIVTIN